MKQYIKKIFKYLPFAITKNQKYDRQTRKVISRVCKFDTNCIDIGCHKGEILDLMIKAAPNGKHYGFEPIPEMYHALEGKYKNTSCTFFDIALSNVSGTITFNHVISNPSYSGIMKRDYDRPNEKDTEIEVKTERLDNILEDGNKIGLIKIDVEGAEMMVLEGAVETIEKNKPVIIFEFGLGASDIYGTKPHEIYQFFTERRYHISLLHDWLYDKKSFSLKAFEQQYFNKTNHYFIAWGN